MADSTSNIPSRFKPVSPWVFPLFLFILVFFISSLYGVHITELTLKDLVDIPLQFLYILKRMIPPSLERLPNILFATLQSFAMAIAGNLIGIPFAFLLSLAAAKNTNPNRITGILARIFITFLRTIPGLVWAIILIITVGLGPRSGAVTLAIATIGFCGRFFAAAIEETDKGPNEALVSIGASRVGIIFSSILPQAIPSFINTILFNLEHSVRSSTVLGIVGAGGIGIELMVSIKTFHYEEASTILILVFIMVLLVEQFCAAIRKKLI